MGVFKFILKNNNEQQGKHMADYVETPLMLDQKIGNPAGPERATCTPPQGAIEPNLRLGPIGPNRSQALQELAAESRSRSHHEPATAT